MVGTRGRCSSPGDGRREEDGRPPTDAQGLGLREAQPKREDGRAREVRWLPWPRKRTPILPSEAESHADPYPIVPVAQKTERPGESTVDSARAQQCREREAKLDVAF